MLKYLALLVLLVAILVVYINDIFQIISPLLVDKSQGGKDTLFTVDELKKFDGVQRPFLYLSVLGNVYNVTKGEQHYGVGQQYYFFVGKDATRNFITGKFEDAETSDDVVGLNEQELRTVNYWSKFYKKEYEKVGKLIGRYYDQFGKLTPYAKNVKELIKKAEKAEKDEQNEKAKFPPCNVEWDQDRGSRVWCTDRSGGIERSWVGKPRQYFEPGAKTYRCACISEENQNLGTVKEYPGCDSDADSCYVNQA